MQRMITTRNAYTPPSIEAAAQPASGVNLREHAAKAIVVHFRHSFGERYLRPASLFHTALVLAVPLGVVQVASFVEFKDLSVTWSSGLGLAAIYLTVVATFGTLKMLSSIALFFFLPCLGLLRLELFSLPFIASPATRWSFVLFYLLFATAALCHMASTRKRKAPPPESAGANRPLWYRVPKWIRLWKDDWDLQLIVEPLLVATIGFTLWLGWGNWFGLFLALTAVYMRDAALERYLTASNAVTQMATSVHHAGAQMRLAAEATGFEALRSEDARSATPFIARREASRKE